MINCQRVNTDMSKPELMARIRDTWRMDPPYPTPLPHRGRLTNCPLCEFGKLHVDFGGLYGPGNQGTVRCRGWCSAVHDCKARCYFELPTTRHWHRHQPVTEALNFIDPTRINMMNTQHNPTGIFNNSAAEANCKRQMLNLCVMHLCGARPNPVEQNLTREMLCFARNFCKRWNHPNLDAVGNPVPGAHDGFMSIVCANWFQRAARSLALFNPATPLNLATVDAFADRNHPNSIFGCGQESATLARIILTGGQGAPNLPRPNDHLLFPGMNFIC